jgi:prepilin-type processing-associated H-X9-DG protein
MSSKQSDEPQFRARRGEGAFTLVELLVVIGIIALLMAMLLPALKHARQVAQRTGCAAKLQQIMQAAQMHRMEHQDYYPLVGLVNGIEPQYLDDTYATKYDYFSNQFNGGNISPNLNPAGYIPRRLAPVIESLAYYLNYRNQMFTSSSAAAVDLMYDPKSYMRSFVCPAQVNDFGELAPMAPAQASELYYCNNANAGIDYQQLWAEPDSYVWNEAILGWNDSLGRLRGKSSRIRQPAMTIFAADGVHGGIGTEYPNIGTFTLCNFTATPPVTMADALNGATGSWSYSPSIKAGDSACFDKKRHQGLINVAFCDGHVESRTISTKDLQKIFLLAP